MILEIGLRFAIDVWVFTAFVLIWSQIVGGRDGRLFVARALLLVHAYLMCATWEQARCYGPRAFQWIVTRIARVPHALVRVIRRMLSGRDRQVSVSVDQHA